MISRPTESSHSAGKGPADAPRLHATRQDNSANPRSPVDKRSAGIQLASQPARQRLLVFAGKPTVEGPRRNASSIRSRLYDSSSITAPSSIAGLLSAYWAELHSILDGQRHASGSRPEARGRRIHVRRE